MPRAAEYRTLRRAARAIGHVANHYGNEIKAEPPLDRDQERFLFDRLATIRRDVDELALQSSNPRVHARIASLRRRMKVVRDHLLFANVKLVASIARKQSCWARDHDDLMNDGLVAVLGAIDSFDPGRGTRFSTYATKAIVNAFYDRHRASGAGAVCSVAAPEAIVDGEAHDHPAARRRNGKPMMAQWPRLLEERQNEEGRVDALIGLLGRLPKRDEEVLTLRFGLAGASALTLETVGGMMKITKQAVRKIELRSIDVLQAQARLLVTA